MTSDKKVYFTKDGYERFKKEYQQLTKVKRPQIIVRLQRAREMGDLAENADYQYAKDELRFLDERLIELKEVLGRAEVVAKEKNPQKIGLGCQIVVKVDGQEQKFFLVGELEADPSQQKISLESPLGQAFLGKKRGDQVKVATPGGQALYLIEKID